MKLKKVLYAGALMSVALLASCSLSDNDGIQLGGRGVQFSASINGQSSVTRVSEDGNSWVDNDKIGIYASTEGDNSEEFATNVQYSTTADGKLSAVGNDAVQYKDESTMTDFKAYYPYSASVTDNNVPINVTNQASQPALDYMYAAVTGKKSSDGDVALKFDHKLVKLVFNITSTSSLAGLGVTLQGTQPTATLNIANGTVTPSGAAVDVTLKTSADGKTSEGIVIPTASLTNVKLVFKNAAGKTQTTSFPSNITSLAGGTKYTIGVKIGETPAGDMNVSFSGATISQWNDVKGDIQIPDFEEGGTTPTDGDGTVDKPFTVAQAILTQDSKNYWIHGYIVGYVNGGSVQSGAKFSTDGATNYNVLLAANKAETDVTKCIPVKLKNDDVRTAIGLQSVPGNLGKGVSIYGTFKKAYGQTPSVIDGSAAILDGGTLVGVNPGTGSDTPAPTTTPGTLTKASELTEGTYAIGYSDNGAFKLMTNEMVNTYYGKSTPWTSGEVPAGCQFTLKKSGDKWLILGADGKYTYIEKTVSNGKTHYNLKFDTTDASQAWTLTDEGIGVKATYGAIVEDWLAYSTQFDNYSPAYSKSTNVVLPSFYKIK